MSVSKPTGRNAYVPPKSGVEGAGGSIVRDQKRFPSPCQQPSSSTPQIGDRHLRSLVSD
jgi:hypothetical protein